MDTAYVCQRIYNEIKALPEQADPTGFLAGMRVVLSEYVPDSLGFIIRCEDGRIIIPKVDKGKEAADESAREIRK